MTLKNQQNYNLVHNYKIRPSNTFEASSGSLNRKKFQLRPDRLRRNAIIISNSVSSTSFLPIDTFGGYRDDVSPRGQQW